VQRRALAVVSDRAAEIVALRDALDVAGPGENELGAVLRDGRPRLFPTVDDDLLRSWAADERALDTLRLRDLRSVLAVPLMAGTRVIGMVTMGTDRSARALGDLELALAREMGIRAGMAVENARLHATRTHIATTLQRSLLPPRLPAVPGMTIAARFRAAGESSEVGGDFYDLFPVDSGWMVVMGDVTGKGPEAAAITSLARFTMRTAAMYERTPAGVLERLNTTLVVDPERRRLCTVICARIVTRSDGAAVITVAGAGHPPPFVLRAGVTERVALAGPLLGAFEGVGWRETDVELAPGESLVLYTDGVTDTSNEDDRFGDVRLGAVLAETGGLEADEIASRVDEALLAFEEGPQRDDVALLVLQATEHRDAPHAIRPEVAATSRGGD
jgi:serine phosphatase RsbU (regulator of sigma subunit)